MEFALVNFLGICVCLLILLFILSLVITKKDLKKLEDRINVFQEDVIHYENLTATIIENSSHEYTERLDKIESIVTAINAAIFFVPVVDRPESEHDAFSPISPPKLRMLSKMLKGNKPTRQESMAYAREVKRKKRLALQKESDRKVKELEGEEKV